MMIRRTPRGDDAAAAAAAGDRDVDVEADGDGSQRAGQANVAIG